MADDYLDKLRQHSIYRAEEFVIQNLEKELAMNPDNPNFRTQEEEQRYEQQRQALRTAQQDYDNLVVEFRKVVAALKECCKPEPDGVGGFVADEFTEQEVLDGRKLLEDLRSRRII